MPYVVAMDTKLKHPFMNRSWDTEYLIAETLPGPTRFFWTQPSDRLTRRPNGFTVFTDSADAVAWALKVEAWLDELQSMPGPRHRYRDEYRIYVKEID